MSEARKRLIECLHSFASDNILRVTASMIAERLYPNARTHNSNGQVFNLASGSVGRQLRTAHIRGVYEIENQVWKIEPNLLPTKEEMK